MELQYALWQSCICLDSHNLIYDYRAVICVSKPTSNLHCSPTLEAMDASFGHEESSQDSTDIFVPYPLED